MRRLTEGTDTPSSPVKKWDYCCAHKFLSRLFNQQEVVNQTIFSPKIILGIVVKQRFHRL